MSETIISVENLSKKYILNHQHKSEKYVALRDVLANSIKNVFKGQNKKDPREDFWALKNISFEVKRGQCIGIIGRNGAGKSTLLKILSRITEPTQGKIRLGGRIASLLEVGTGFHPELTGRENIYLNGAILGMSREEIRKKFTEIIEFAEVEKFLDTPVKRYSSGMYMRLAFAVAAHLEPEILVVDEVLAVGDISFQKKCLNKMGDLAHKESRTVLFVSHNMDAINQLCSESIWLNKGEIAEQGKANEVVSNYLSHEKKYKKSGLIVKEDHYHEQPKGLIFQKINLLDTNGEPTTTLTFQQKLCMLSEFSVVEDVNNIRIGIVIHNIEGKLIAALHQTDDWKNSVIALTTGNYQLYLEVELNLVPGFYNISLFTKPIPGFWNSQDYSWEYVENAVIFTVEPDPKSQQEFFSSGGLILPETKWMFTKIS